MVGGVRGKGIYRTVYSFCTLPPNFNLLFSTFYFYHINFYHFSFYFGLCVPKNYGKRPLILTFLLKYYNILLFSLFYSFPHIDVFQKRDKMKPQVGYLTCIPRIDSVNSGIYSLYIIGSKTMVRFVLHTDFDCDAQFRYSPELSLSVFSIKDYVYDYMSTYKVSHLELFMSQNLDTPFQYQFDCYADFDDSGSLVNFYTTRQYDKLKIKLHTTTQEIF